MDIDNELDETLLMQFSCMGTTDKDELVKQLQTLLALNPNTATFFLEMNNWNLQGAVGSYFDAYFSLNVPSMTLLRESSMVEETRVDPGTSFIKCWEVLNSSDEVWPPGCCLQFAGGSKMTAQDRLPVASVAPWSRGTLRLDLTAPEQPGIYQSKWRMSTTSGNFFGEIIWVIVTVVDQSLNGLTQQFNSSLAELGSGNQHTQTNATPEVIPSSPVRHESESEARLDEDLSMMCQHL